MATIGIFFANSLKFYFISCYFSFNFVFSVSYIDFQTVADCKTGVEETHEFFDISQLRCRACAQNASAQTVSEDGLQCICQPGHRLVQDYGGAAITCMPCAVQEIVSDSGWECVKCGTAGVGVILPEGDCPACSADGITVERNLNGSWLNAESPTKTCEPCAGLTWPDETGGRCVRCNQYISVLGEEVMTECDCPLEQTAGGLCFQDDDDLIEIDGQQIFKVPFGDEEIDSQFFADNVRSSEAMCGGIYANISACQVIGNMCALIMYTRERDGSGAGGSPDDVCAAYIALTSEGRTQTEWPINMPWLYYYEDTADQILSDTRITTEYTFPSQLKFKVAKYTLTGDFLGIDDITGGELQLCKNTDTYLDAAYEFGTDYNQVCDIAVSDLFDTTKNPLVFYDMYIEYELSGGGTQLYAIPVLVTNYIDSSGSRPNTGDNQDKWQLTRRFFLVDNESGRELSVVNGDDVTGGQATPPSTRPKAINYASSISFYITLQDGTSKGQIYPPYVEITYTAATEEQLDENVNVQVDFSVSYSMDMSSRERSMSVAAGVLSGFAIAYGILETYGWFKRAGKLTIDCVTLIKWIIFTIGALSNVFLAVSFGSAVWWIIMYKNQSSVYLLLPTSSQDDVFVTFLVLAFVFKIIQVAHLMYCQIDIDIFFVDWERPHGKLAQAGSKQKPQDVSVSIWRTYFAANEWNEIQTVRKTNAVLQIFLVLFFLHTVGFKNIVTGDPTSDFDKKENKYYSDDSQVFRYAVGGLVYILVAVAQWLFFTFIYERFFEDKVRQYVDLCSLSNISVFVLDHDHFGYYIHGRSVHGRADTGLREMAENLKREEESLCGQRGLLPNTEQQTFEMAIPHQLREQYNREYAPIKAEESNMPPPPTMGRPDQNTNVTHISPHTDRKIQAYIRINRLLQAFVDHAIADIDYGVKDKRIFESILGVEFGDATQRGVMYNDDGHSFDSVLFFGHELTLLTFDLIVFCIIDLASGSYVLSGVITYLISSVLAYFRASLGQWNLARKTLVDKRFLI